MCDGIRACLRVGSVDPALVAIEARRYADEPRTRRARVIRLPDRVPADTRPPPTLFDYDQLLAGPARQDVS